jgi:hypothetical protein
MIQPTKTFRETRRERFEEFWAIECAARKNNNNLDKNTAWVTWQVCEALCCNAFFDAGAIVPN